MEDAANLRRDREKELTRVVDEHHKVLETNKALELNMRSPLPPSIRLRVRVRTQHEATHPRFSHGLGRAPTLR